MFIYNVKDFMESNLNEPELLESKKDGYGINYIDLLTDPQTGKLSIFYVNNIAITSTNLQ